MRPNKEVSRDPWKSSNCLENAMFLLQAFWKSGAHRDLSTFGGGRGVGGGGEANLSKWSFSRKINILLIFLYLEWDFIKENMEFDGTIK